MAKEKGEVNEGVFVAVAIWTENKNPISILFAYNLDIVDNNRERSPPLLPPLIYFSPMVDDDEFPTGIRFIRIYSDRSY